ncbi:amino acid permease [Enterococcus gilvus]|uniref:Glutamate:gamma-aminobutyrate antiporter n=1 Tax=Enterococcus gilvus ATCC BAA-350 TaxID=1158614 RepID=R2V742_9ENTE|nr:amino acid permease [Enterococcus gilvus]EOI53555.1 glutamate:gamma-aminobutyrate antiporter [Enterococcus gilvus ATCC BAA-350]EOW81170.1 glutamate:gamma-aminobutyrate antiporter [Enterococcus gilvus ATCC BAA-350]
MNKSRKMSKFAFFSMTASLFITVYEYPTFASTGKALIFFLLLCGLGWFLPVALCSAELATAEGYQEGGIYSWVGKPLGEKYGFAALFFQWFQVTVGFVTMIYFIVGTLAYILKIPAINEDPLFKFLTVIGIFWLLTLLQLKGTETTAKLAKYGFSIGIVLPVIVLLLLTIKYFMTGHAISTNFTDSSFIPKGKNIGALTSFVLAYMGVEASASHFSDLEDAKNSYPKLLMLLVVVGILMSTIGGSIVSMVLSGTISSDEGVMDTATRLVSSGHVGWGVKLIGFLISFGILAQVSSWIVSPTEGLQFAATKNLLPKKLGQKNSNDVPVRILIIQAIVVSVWAALLTFGASSSGGNVGFQTAISLTVLIYLSAYILFFVSYFVVLLKHKELKREFSIPGNTFCKALIGGIGLVISVAAVCTAFIVPTTIAESDSHVYLMSLSIGFVVTVAMPFVFYRFYSVPNKKRNEEKGVSLE